MVSFHDLVQCVISLNYMSRATGALTLGTSLVSAFVMSAQRRRAADRRSLFEKTVDFILKKNKK